MTAGPGYGWLHSRGTPTVWRRLFHLSAGSSVPLAGIFLPRTEFLIGLAALAGGSLLLDLLRFRADWLNRYFLVGFSPLLKSDEDRRITGATYLLLSGLAAFLLFGPPVAVAAMFFLSLGDPAAALVGRRAPGPRWFGKSPVGTLAFVGVSWLVVGLLVVTDVVPYHWGFLLGGLVAGLTEFLPIPLDDNLTVPLLSGALMWWATG